MTDANSSLSKTEHLMLCLCYNYRNMLESRLLNNLAQVDKLRAISIAPHIDSFWKEQYEGLFQKLSWAFAHVATIGGKKLILTTASTPNNINSTVTQIVLILDQKLNELIKKTGAKFSISFVQSEITVDYLAELINSALDLYEAEVELLTQPPKVQLSI